MPKSLRLQFDDARPHYLLLNCLRIFYERSSFSSRLLQADVLSEDDTPRRDSGQGDKYESLLSSPSRKGLDVLCARDSYSVKDQGPIYPIWPDSVSFTAWLVESRPTQSYLPRKGLEGSIDEMNCVLLLFGGLHKLRSQFEYWICLFTLFALCKVFCSAVTGIAFKGRHCKTSNPDYDVNKANKTPAPP